MKRKTCIICKTKLKPVQQLFCSNNCYLIGVEETKKESEYLRLQKEVLKKQQEVVELETEVLYAKKQNLILRESTGFDSPFTANYKDKIPYDLVE
jgi:predicted nucleic acid-binding Zn ribbon protein